MSPDPSPPLLVIVGPTASGKTELALRIAERQRGEIVSADSVQIYRRFDVGSGKPSAEDRARAPHHLIDCADPLQPFDAAAWARRAEQTLDDIVSRGRVPIVCGGTFLWVRALVFGLAPAPPRDDAVRQRHREREATEGRDALHRELGTVDPKAAERLSPNDFVRVSRALEVYELSGVPLSQWHEEHGFRDRRHDARFVGISHDPAALDDRIGVRVRDMLSRGWIDEVRGLIRDGFGEARAMRSVGYRQIAEALAHGSVDETALSDAIVRGTRVFVRRQRTWLRDEPVEWLSPEQAERGLDS